VLFRSATALALAAAGAFIGVHYNASAAGAQETLARIRGAGGDGMLLAADLTEEDEANRAVDELAGRAGRLDIVVNNAGTMIRRMKLEDCPLELWKRVLDTNLTSAFIVTRRAIPYLRASGKGAIVNNLYLAVQTGGANGAGAYAASKGGLQVFTRTLARELAPQVRVNAVMPGVIETPHHEQFSTPQRMVQYAAETPLGRNGRASEVAEAILFLVSDEASFVNGSLLDISGGRFLR
jgi:3-oxoacyl-[acyl-carrier protein] reductase